MDALLGLLPLILVIALIWFVARRFSAKAGQEQPGPNGEVPYGVRGWLAFFVYMSMTLGPLLSLGRLNQSLLDVESKYPALRSLDGWDSYKAASWTALLIVIAWQFWVATELKNKLVPASLTKVRILLVAAPLLVALSDATFAGVFLNVSVGAEAVGQYLGGAIVSAIWLAYFYRSKRVRNTYGRRETTGEEGVPAAAMLTPGEGTALRRQEEAPLTTGQSAAPLHGPRAAATPADGIEATAPQPANPAEVPRSIEARLHELKGLLERGLISEIDFEAKKREILSGL